MYIEIEAKFRVDSHEPVRERLRALGATCLGRVIESNEILDRPDGALRRGGRGLRIRTARCEHGAQEAATLTLKGPRRAGAFKSREELQIEVSSAETASDILGKLGYVRMLSYQKLRESWSYNSCRIELDEPPRIGLFVEIEGPDDATIRSVQSELGLASLGHTPQSYVGMLLDYCLEHGVADRVLKWPDDGPSPPEPATPRSI